MVEATELPNLRFLLLEAGVKQADIAAALGVTSQAVNRVVRRKTRAIRIELAIAERLGRDVRELFVY